MTKILIAGEGGQGVRVIAQVLATLAANLGLDVKLLYDYDSSVRGAMSTAHLTFASSRIDNPVIDKADILLELSNKAGALVARKTVCETGLCTDEEIPFSQLGEKEFGKEIFGNMIALGRLIQLVDLPMDEDQLKKALPEKYLTENLQAIHFGYNLREHELERGLNSAISPKSDFAATTPGTGDLEFPH